MTGTTAVQVAALTAADARVRAAPGDPEAHRQLSAALLDAGRPEEAVAASKRGLAVASAPHEGLTAVLRAARLAVLDELMQQEEEDEEEEEEEQEKEADGDDGGSGNDHTQQQQQRNALIVLAPPSRAAAAPTLGEALAQSHHDHGHQQPPTRAPGPRPATEVVDPASFDAKVERLLTHLDPGTLARMGLAYALVELLGLWRVRAGLALAALGLVAQMLVHRHKLMLASMVVVGLAQSALRPLAARGLERWLRTSTDRLGAVVWLPRVLVAVPIVLKLTGLLKFMLFLRRDLTLGFVVAVTTGACVALAAGSALSESWGHGKRLKLVAYVSAVGYWALWRGRVADTVHLVGPALLDAAGVVLGALPPDELQGCCRRAWGRLADELASRVHEDVGLDGCFFLGLSNWLIDYWQQPTTLSLEMLRGLVADGFGALETSTVRAFGPELRRLRAELRGGGASDELGLVVAYWRRSLAAVPPPRGLALIGLVARTCPAFVVGALLLVFYGTLPLALGPFVASEVADARALYALYDRGGLAPMDGLEILLLGSPLLGVWENLKAAVAALEGGVVFARTVATGAQILTTASRLGHIAAFVAKVGSGGGLAAHAEELPERLAQAFLIARDYHAIVDGVRAAWARWGPTTATATAPRTTICTENSSSSTTE